MRALVSRRVVGAAVVLAATARLIVPAGAKAPARRYVAGSGVVTDTVTRLAWQQLVSAGRYSWDDARTYCKALDLKGVGWRLPTIKELLTIVDEAATPAIDPVFLPTTDPSYAPDSTKGQYWSSTRSASYDSEAWELDFSSSGAPGPAYVALGRYVRCVR